MSRSYAAVRAKTHRTYSVDELMALYDVSRNTVTNWIKAGLKPSDKGIPYVFRGALVCQFHDDRRARYRTRLEPGEFKCLGCKAAVRPSAETVGASEGASGRKLLQSRCPECNAHVVKLASDADLAVLAGEAIPNTSGDCAHEEDSPGPARVGNGAAQTEAPVHLRNDRTIAAWQLYAARHSEKTQDRHLAAIRKFEAFVRGKSFARLSQEDVSGFRRHLRSALVAEGEGVRAKSTVSHTLSHVRDFLTWLGKQKGFESLPRDLPDYLELSRADYAEALPRARRPHPSIEKAEAMLAAMPQGTKLARRARALFATAFLGALRADTLVSLRVGHVFAADRVIVQDGTVSRTKNGKSLRVHWFPIPDAFGDELKGWLEELAALGAGPEDALFPPEDWFNAPRRGEKGPRTPVLPMTSTHAASEAFRIACRTVEASYTPHAAKHTIAALRKQLRLTEEQRKAWCQNMGHETEVTTETYYGKLSDERCDELFEEMREGGGGTADRPVPDEVIADIKQQVKGLLGSLQRLGVDWTDMI